MAANACADLGMAVARFVSIMEANMDNWMIRLGKVFGVELNERAREVEPTAEVELVAWVQPAPEERQDGKHALLAAGTRRRKAWPLVP